MLFIMRHGKTDWNAEYKLQGGSDTPLNETGRQMARDARARYGDMHFDICYCSPLGRAQETARLFLEGTSTPIQTEPRLVEMNFGIYEGKKGVTEDPDCPMYLLFRDPEHYQAPEGAESFEQVFARTESFLREVVEPALAAGKNILLVGHGATNSCIINRYQKVPMKDFWTTLEKNCELVQLVVTRENRVGS